LIGFIWPPQPRRKECIHCIQLGFPATVKERRVDRFISTSLLPLLVSAFLFFSCEFRGPWELNVLDWNSCVSKIETKSHENTTKTFPSFIKRPYTAINNKTSHRRNPEKTTEILWIVYILYL
jgi:hypothetical protein